MAATALPSSELFRRPQPRDRKSIRSAIQSMVRRRPQLRPPAATPWEFLSRHSLLAQKLAARSQTSSLSVFGRGLLHRVHNDDFELSLTARQSKSDLLQ